MNSWQIKTPCRLLCVGPSESGKTTLLLKLLEDNSVFDRPFRTVLYCSPASLDVESLKGLRGACVGKTLEICTEIPHAFNEIAEIYQAPTLIVFDDLLGHDPKKKDAILQLCTRASHHSKLSCFFAVQNPFAKSKSVDMTTLSRNITGMFIMQLRNDFYVYSLLNKRIFPERKNFLLMCINHAEEVGCRYIYLNLDPHSPLPREISCCTALFNSERKHGSPIFFNLNENRKP